MKRSSMAAIAVLTALPAAVIINVALSTSVSTAPANAANIRVLTDASGSGAGYFQWIWAAPDCHTMVLGMVNPDPGQLVSIEVTGGGTTNTLQSVLSSVGGRLNSLSPSTTYTITMTSGSDQYSITKSTPAC